MDRSRNCIIIRSPNFYNEIVTVQVADKAMPSSKRAVELHRLIASTALKATCIRRLYCPRSVPYS